MKGLTALQGLFVAKQNVSDNIVLASYIVNEIIAKHSKSYSDGDCERMHGSCCRNFVS